MLLSAAAVALCSAFCFGLNNGMLNSPERVIRTDFGLVEGGLGDSLWSLCISIYSLGALVGCIGAPVLADRHGRRKFIHANATLYIIGAVLQAGAKLFATSAAGFGLFLFIAGRAVVGIASGGSTVVVPLYLGEIAPASLRGKLGTAFQVTVTLSMLTAQVLGLPVALGTPGAWPVLLFSPVLPCAAQLLLHGRLLESPRWLSSHGRGEEAMAATQRFHAGRGSSEVQVGNAGAATSTSESGSGAAPIRVLELLRTPRWRSPLRFCVVTMAVQQFSGINNVFNYSSAFLNANGVNDGVVGAITVSMNVANVLVTCVAAWLIDRVGRRPLLLGSTVGMIVTILLLTLGLALPPSNGASGLIGVAVIAYVGSFGCGQGPVPWMLPAELFPTHARATAGGVAAACNWLSNFCVAQVSAPEAPDTPSPGIYVLDPRISSPLRSAQLFLALAGGLHSFAFVPFAVVLVAFLIYAHRTMPETRGRSLEELATAFEPLREMRDPLTADVMSPLPDMSRDRPNVSAAPIPLVISPAASADHQHQSSC